MNGYNRVILKGTTGQDATVKTLENGNSVATVSLAINESYTDKQTGERKTKTEWVRVEAWKGLAEWLGKHVKKGTDLLIEGRIKTDSWEQEGQTK
ncbi:MAG: single-stranded DNA-binding protein, partial [Nanoarchaeota archaeon]